MEKIRVEFWCVLQGRTERNAFELEKIPETIAQKQNLIRKHLFSWKFYVVWAIWFLIQIDFLCLKIGARMRSGHINIVQFLVLNYHHWHASEKQESNGL